MTLAASIQATAPPNPPSTRTKPQGERMPVAFSPAIRRVAHILYAAGNAVPVSAIAENAAVEPNGVPTLISSVRMAIMSTGATIDAEFREDGARCYRLRVPSRPAFERLVGPAPDGVIAETVSFHGLTGPKAVILREIMKADGAYVSLSALTITVYGRETAKAREKICAFIRLIRGNLLTRDDPGAILSQGTGRAIAYAWSPEREVRVAAEAAPAKRLDGVTLPAIGCAAWRFYPALGERRGAHVVRLRGEDQDRVFTDADRAAQPMMSALSAPHGVWPPKKNEDAEAA